MAETKERSEKADKIISIITLALMGLEAVLTILFGVLVIDFNILPALYLTIVIVVLLGILAGIFFLGRKNNIRRIISGIISLAMCFILGVGCYYIYITNRTIDTITGEGYSIKIYRVVVMQDDPAETLADALDYNFGTVSSYEIGNLEEAMELINEDAGREITTTDYSAVNELLDAWYAREVDGMIYESSLGGVFDDLNENYYLDYKVIAEFSVKVPESEIESTTAETTTVETTTAEETSAEVSETMEPFVVLISGNDEYYDVSVTGRSDVNMIAVVDYSNRQVLLASIPRDYYVNITGVSGDDRDKLTHSSNYGMETLVATINDTFSINIDYYVRVNFTSVVNIIDAVGGLAFYNPYAFGTTYYDYWFDEGEVWCDGWQALQYARERKSLEDGDIARGEHQQIIIEAMIDKLVSAASLTHYTAIMDAIETCAVTDMPQEIMKELVRLQLQDGGGWEIIKTQALGEAEILQPCYSVGGMELSIVMPYKESIEHVSYLINKAASGEIITDEDQVEPETYTYVTELIQ